MPIRILYVEDETDTRSAVTRLLRAEGHSVTAVHNCAAAHAAAGRATFDLLISDLGLPDGSGLRLLRDLRKLFPIRGIALSGYETPSESGAAGYTFHLLKPIEFSSLQFAIEEVMKIDVPAA